jgi:two-component system LytT family response regulator
MMTGAENGGKPARSAADSQMEPSDGNGGRPVPFLSRLLVHENDRNVLVDMSEIRWIGAERSYARIYVGSVSYAMRTSLARIAERLDPERFVRIHRSTIVNLDHVRDVVRWFGSDYMVRLHDGDELRLSRTYWQGFKQRLFVE